jgi:three-Cys-motif partner protein
MTWNKNTNGEPPGDEWGGPWTQKKLDAFSKYVRSYLTIMKKYPYWKTIYFDGFAGSGSKKSEAKTELYEQLKITEEEENVYEGSAEKVLKLGNEMAFDYYYFIDKNKSALKKLEKKLQDTVNVGERKIEFKPGNANEWILKLAEAMATKKYAALVFLDPFGMQIDWNSIAALKGTRSDVWVLVPTGVIVNRLLDKAGKLEHTAKLQSFFGLTEQEIKDIFYKQETRNTLFGEEEFVNKISKPIERIAQLYGQRMKTIWDYVTETPLRLDNRNGAPLFHFVFASNNKNALKIASQIIEKV